jgi:WD repeat-containing protein 23
VDEYDIMEQLFGGGMRRGTPTEDTSLKKIKNVQGVPGNWTITDCDADKKAEK